MKKKQKLKLEFQTLRALTEDRLSGVAGGKIACTPTFPTDSALAGGCGVTNNGCGGASNRSACL